MTKNKTVAKKDREIKEWVNRRFLFCLVLIASVFLTLNVASADAPITQGYNATTSMAPGTMVSLNPSGPSNTVTSSNLTNVANIIGVVVADNSSQVALNSGSNQVQVATSGVTQVLVSTINGNIVSGDDITASAISGVGMLANENGEVIGTAQGSFPNQTSTKEAINTSSGKQTVDIGSVGVLISIGYFTKQPAKTIIPTAIQNLANALAGKTVKTLPIILSAVIFILTLIVVVSIVYSLIHSSIISVGRNPMAQSAVYRNVLQLSALVIGIIAVAMFAIFMILTKLS